MNKRYYEHTLPIIRGSLSNTYRYAAVSACADNIMYISRPSEKLQISAVSQDCETVRYIEEPCEKAVIVALKENPGLFMYIHNSSPSRVITTLVEKDMEKKREAGKQEKV